MKKLYTGMSLLLLIFVLSLGTWALASGGIPEIGTRNLATGQYASLFHNSLGKSLPGKDRLADWNRYLNRFYTFAGFSQGQEIQILVPIVNDGADHGAAVPELNVQHTLTAEPEETQPPLETITEKTEESIIETTEAPSESVTEEETVYEEPQAEVFGQILLLGDRAIELPVADYNAIRKYGESVSAIADALDGVDVYSLLVPNSAGLYAPEAYRQDQDSQQNMIDYAYHVMDDSVIEVDAFPVLQEHKDEYIYFRTDHHWTHLGSYYAYTAFCKEAGLNPHPLTDYDSGTYDTFLGTMYSFLSGYSQREILRENPDDLTYYIPFRETKVRYYDSGNLSYGGKIDMVYPLSDNYSNKYICFLGGDHPVTIIETDYPEERVCLLIKESYGNAFATWLTGHYSKIICIDPREFNRNDKPGLDIKEFSDRMGVDDCIILNYPLMINSSAYGAWLGRLVK